MWHRSLKFLLLFCFLPALAFGQTAVQNTNYLFAVWATNGVFTSGLSLGGSNITDWSQIGTGAASNIPPIGASWTNAPASVNTNGWPFGAGGQTPWLSKIDAAGHSLTNVLNLLVLGNIQANGLGNFGSIEASYYWDAVNNQPLIDASAHAFADTAGNTALTLSGSGAGTINVNSRPVTGITTLFGLNLLSGLGSGSFAAYPADSFSSASQLVARAVSEGFVVGGASSPTNSFATNSTWAVTSQSASNLLATVPAVNSPTAGAVKTNGWNFGSGTSSLLMPTPDILVTNGTVGGTNAAFPYISPTSPTVVGAITNLVPNGLSIVRNGTNTLS